MKIFIVTTDSGLPTRYFRKLTTMGKAIGIPVSTLRKDFGKYKDEKEGKRVKRLSGGVVFVMDLVTVE